MSNNNHSYLDSIDIIVNAPVLNCTKVSFSNLDGEPTDRFIKGESSLMTFDITNSGHSKSFNLTRLEKLVRWTLVTDRAYNIKTLWMYVTMTCIFFQLPNLSYAISHLTNDTYDLVKVVIIVMPLSILAAGGSYFFYSFYLWKDGIRELTMLPASKAEKFAVRFLMPILLHRCHQPQTYTAYC